MPYRSQFIIIEDNLIDQFVIKKLLKKGLDVNPVYIANNGKEGMNWIQKNQNQSPLIILLDIQMPVMDGFEFLKEFDKLPEDVKEKIEIFVLSSTLDSDEIKKVKENKYVSDFWNKPFRLETLKSVFLEA
ncbi:MAG: response regulator [Flavobacterium nitrogenifigens]|uniref:CheY chemotaxis protein or a CheY-like REC (Receiver) domain n=1 Tax=Flavobacterium nitrogenifigens TaxID=1617283 RepID=A0A521EUF5_9FLAO|nr:response regulator [Flavobacterium nitrogenifigens]KAF2338761.1 response regulator [Flavobacterium nitrogenifigens]MDQ8014338.1 response regulator [Flavobacterium nitrogenifigens]SMO86750.1 CheY chemotaxis protein or a CheY-like REC (receiver) domain [Flavobacterium nitrogenifigens]